MYNLAIIKCTSPPLLAPRLKIFNWKFTTPPGIEPRTCWTRGRHATIWASAASLSVIMLLIPFCETKFFTNFENFLFESCPIYSTSSVLNFTHLKHFIALYRSIWPQYKRGKMIFHQCNNRPTYYVNDYNSPFLVKGLSYVFASLWK